MQVRLARPEDRLVIADFNVRLAEETESLRLDPDVVSAGVEAVLLDRLKGAYYVAEVDGSLAGQIMVTHEWSDWHNSDMWWLQSVYVRQEFRRRGVFRGLFEHVARLARQDGHVCSVRLYMHRANARAQQTYQEAGMENTPYVVMEMRVPGAAV